MRLSIAVVTLVWSAHAAVQIEKTNFQGWRNCYRIPHNFRSPGS